MSGQIFVSTARNDGRDSLFTGSTDFFSRIYANVNDIFTDDTRQ